MSTRKENTKEAGCVDEGRTQGIRVSQACYSEQRQMETVLCVLE